MYGWRVRIGHVAPSRGDTLVYEFYQMMPAGFMILNSTGTIRQLVDADLERQLQRIEEAAADLVDNKCDSVIIGGSPLFTKLGYGSDTEMGKRLERQVRRAGLARASPAKSKRSNRSASTNSWSPRPTKTRSTTA